MNYVNLNFTRWYAKEFLRRKFYETSDRPAAGADGGPEPGCLCGGSASSSAASSEAASESASKAASSEPEATPAPAVSNYFAEHGVEVLPSLPEKSPKVYYCTWQKDNPDVYAQWDDADISFSQTVEPSDEKGRVQEGHPETEVLCI